MEIEVYKQILGFLRKLDLSMMDLKIEVQKVKSEVPLMITEAIEKRKVSQNLSLIYKIVPPLVAAGLTALGFKAAL